MCIDPSAVGLAPTFSFELPGGWPFESLPNPAPSSSEPNRGDRRHPRRRGRRACDRSDAGEAGVLAAAARRLLLFLRGVVET